MRTRGDLAEGCVFDYFLLTAHLPPHQVSAVIEREWQIMSEQPGINHTAYK